ncbi:hypothetical protein OHA72_41085 [Dactylosporangium sp. NBC_01737]|uniref:hypothetical protein n=1 Tax=Dactylosporangium sp. NBC_01737 TaxID=2975959 RepID=UPI002E0EA4CA|nr:hypothetical protein OHA72_41085 [Dactylosporangium sp. NBC_01737]
MDVDERVRQAFAVGRPLNLGGADVPAALLMELLTGELPTRRAALRLHEARVTGKLVLSFAEVTCPLLVQESEFLEAPDLYWARLAFTGFRSTRLPGLHAAGVTIAGHLRMSGVRCTGVVNLRGAKISGGLLLDRAHLLRPGGTALLAERLELGGDLVAEHGFRAEGTLRLFQASITGGIHLDDATVLAPPAVPDAPPETFHDLGDGETVTPRPGDAQGIDLDSATVHGGVFVRRATIDGEVSLRHGTVGGVATFTGATLRNPGAVALRLDRADVGGGVHLLGGCRVEGELRLVGTRVGRILRLAGAALANPGGHALRADNCTVDGPVDCRDGFTAVGEVSLLEARVAGPVFFEGAHLDNPDGTSLRATGIVTGSLLHCGDGFTATGRVTMRAARIGGRLSFHDAHLQGVWCTGAEAAEVDLRFAERPAGRLDLRYLRAALLRDDPATWPADLRLDGLTYQTLTPLLAPSQRLEWLARTSDGLPPQPYEQLAAVYRQLGHDEDARTVLLAKQRRRRSTRPWWTWPWSWLQDVTVGYGYRPQRAALWLLALLVVGTAVFTAWRPAPVNPGQPPELYPAIYTLDLLLPIIDFGQEPAYRPTGAGQWVAFLFIAAGWTLATTVAAGFTRVLSRG